MDWNDYQDTAGDGFWFIVKVLISPFYFPFWILGKIIIEVPYHFHKWNLERKMKKKDNISGEIE